MNMFYFSVRKALTIVASVAFFFSSGWAAVLTVSPSPSVIGLNGVTAADIIISDLDASLDLGAFALDINYDPSILQFVSYELGDNLGEVDDIEAMDLSFGASFPGQVNIAETSLLADLSGQSNDAFTIGKLMFKGIGLGNSLISISGTLGDGEGAMIAYSVNSGSASVPEPRTFFMVAIGLIGLVTLKRGVSRNS
jgi:hypothetical protein